MSNIEKSFSRIFICLVMLSSIVSEPVFASVTVDQLQSRWDRTNFQLTGKAQIEDFEKLQADAIAYTEANPNHAEGWVWSGIIQSSFAGAKGGLGALGLAKKARKDFDMAISIDGAVMGGSAYTSLGTLYFSVPGWPIGFGDDEKAEELLLKGLGYSPDGMTSNFFYAEFLRDEKMRDEAERYYRKALAAPPRTNRPIADEGRRKQIEAALSAMQK